MHGGRPGTVTRPRRRRPVRDRRRSVAAGQDGRDPVGDRDGGTGRRRAAAPAGDGLRPGAAGQRRGHGADVPRRAGRDRGRHRRFGGQAGGPAVHPARGARAWTPPATGRPGAAARSGPDRPGALAGVHAAALDAGSSAVFAFPLRMGGIRLGVLDLYRDRAGALSDQELAEALAFADAATMLLLQLQSLDPDGGRSARPSFPWSRTAPRCTRPPGWSPSRRPFRWVRRSACCRPGPSRRASHQRCGAGRPGRAGAILERRPRGIHDH